MKTLAELKARCEIEGTCWVWPSATAQNRARIHAFDYGKGRAMTQDGRRAAWQMKHRKAIPNGWRAFGTCDVPLCVNPDHCEPMSVAEYGRRTADAGVLRGNMRRVIANRAICRKRTAVTREIYEAVLASDKTGVELAKELGITRNVISKIRTGKFASMEPAGGIFTGLIAANDSHRKAA